MDKIKRKIYLDKIINFMKKDYPLFKNLRDYGFHEQLSYDELIYVLYGIFEQPVKCDNISYGQIFDKNGNLIYKEFSDGYWVKMEYDENGNRIYFEDSDGVIEDNR